MLSGFVSNLMFFIPRGGGVGFGDSFFTFFLFFLSDLIGLLILRFQLRILDLICFFLIASSLLKSDYDLLYNGSYRRLKLVMFYGLVWYGFCILSEFMGFKIFGQCVGPEKIQGAWEILCIEQQRGTTLSANHQEWHLNQIGQCTENLRHLQLK
ncbi:hypothetical protein AAG906_003934 [Vitis piasezkii]